MPQTDELRIFISSTFRDMEAEREHLLRRVFPEIRALCRLRGVTFTEIDLRWGLTEEEATLGRVIRTCLEEIDRCRPHFIGMIGSRYGWVPEYHEVAMDPELLSRFPHVEEMAIEGKSITEIEFTHGVLAGGSEVESAIRFYSRQSERASDEDGERINQMIKGIREAGLRVDPFESVEELGEKVRRGLLETIDRYWPESGLPDENQRENRVHTAFARSRRRAFIPDPTAITRFNLWMASGTAPLLIRGQSGYGKSALSAFLVDTFRQKNRDAFVVEHYVGASERSGRAIDAIRYSITSIIDEFELEEKVPESDQSLLEGFSPWLFRLGHLAQESGRMVLILIDGVDRFPERDLEIFPINMPTNVHLLLTASPGPATERLKELESLELGPIDDQRRRQGIVIRYLGEYHKGISGERLQRIASAENSAVPLFLRLIAEELRLHGDHNTLDEAIDRLLEPDDLAGAFDALLSRLESDFGAETLRSILSLLALAETGLSEVEILGISNITRMDLSALLPSLDHHLIWSGGLLSFHHDVLRSAVERRYLRNADVVTEVRRSIADWFGSEPASPRTIYELLPQLDRLGDTEKIIETLSRTDLFFRSANDKSTLELFPWWMKVSTPERMVEVYHSIILEETMAVRNELSSMSPAEKGRESVKSRLRQLSRSILPIVDAGASLILTKLYQQLREIFTPLLPPEHEMLLDINYGIIRADWSNGVIEGLPGRIADHLRRLRSVPEVNWRQVVDTKNFHAVALAANGESAQAEEIHREIIAMEDLAVTTRTNSLSNLAELCMRSGAIEEAEELMQQALTLKRQHYGNEHPVTAMALNNLGAIHHFRGDHEASLAYMKEAAAIRRQVFGDRHFMTLRSLGNVATTLNSLERYEEAAEILAPLITLVEEVIGKDHQDMIEYLQSFATATTHLQRFEEAEVQLDRADSLLPNAQPALHLFHSVALRYNRAQLRYAQGKREEAISLLREILAEAEDRTQDFDQKNVELVRTTLEQWSGEEIGGE